MSALKRVEQGSPRSNGATGLQQPHPPSQGSSGEGPRAGLAVRGARASVSGGAFSTTALLLNSTGPSASGLGVGGPRSGKPLTSMVSGGFVSSLVVQRGEAKRSAPVEQIERESRPFTLFPRPPGAGALTLRSVLEPAHQQWPATASSAQVAAAAALTALKQSPSTAAVGPAPGTQPPEDKRSPAEIDSVHALFEALEPKQQDAFPTPGRSPPQGDGVYRKPVAPTRPEGAQPTLAAGAGGGRAPISATNTDPTTRLPVNRTLVVPLTTTQPLRGPGSVSSNVYGQLSGHLTTATYTIHAEPGEQSRASVGSLPPSHKGQAHVGGGASEPRKMGAPQSARARVSSAKARAEELPQSLTARAPVAPVTAEPPLASSSHAGSAFLKEAFANRTSPPPVDAKSEGTAPKADAPTPSAEPSKGAHITPAASLAAFESQLSRFERKELLQYPQIFFLGLRSAKIDAPVANAANSGFDDERGDYVVVKGDHIAYRYEVLGELGKGSFGQVLKVYDHKTNDTVALKIIRNKKRFHQQALVEIRILEHLKARVSDDRSCTVVLLDQFEFRNHRMLIFPLHSMNLYELAKLNKYHPFAPPLIKRFAAQLLIALSFLWRERIVHCDLKPENILLKTENKTTIRVIDFGSSCFENERIYTYIQSRFYRAPEVILGIPYTRSIDSWSLGCIICEMALGYPIFPGENEQEQLLCVMEVLGAPPAKLVDRSPRKKHFFDNSGEPRIVPNSRGRVRRPGTKTLKEVLKCDDDRFIEFIMLFLQWDPAERTNPLDAMHHPYIADCFHHQPSQGGGATSNAPQPPAQPPAEKAQPRRLPSAGPATARTLPQLGTEKGPSLGTRKSSAGPQRAANGAQRGEVLPSQTFSL